MAREIKFRAWDDCAEKMVIAGLDDDYIFVKDECGFCVYGDDGMEIYHLELMQYTGINDKDDVEIYEGDVVRVIEPGIDGGSFHIVKYYAHHDYPAFDLYPVFYEESNSFSGVACSLQYEIEVVGNIYENPELVEAVNE